MSVSVSLVTLELVVFPCIHTYAFIVHAYVCMYLFVLKKHLLIYLYVHKHVYLCTYVCSSMFTSSLIRYVCM